MAGLRGLFTQRDGSNNGTTPRGARLALGGLLAPAAATALSVRTGVLVDDMTPVVAGTGSMAYQVRSFVAVTKFTDANGPVVAANDAAVTVETTPAPGSNSRIDRVWMVHRLITADGGSGATNVFEFGVTQGSVAASPTPPTSLPAGAIPLWDFLVTAGATSTSGLTGTRRHDWTVARGGIIPDAAGATSGLWWNGAAWIPVGGLGDTGWTSTTMVAPFSGEAYVRRVGKSVTSRGTINRASGNSAAFVTAFTVPSGFRPATDLDLGAVVSGGASPVYGRARVLATGEFQITQAVANSNPYGVGGFTWYID